MSFWLFPPQHLAFWVVQQVLNKQPCHPYRFLSCVALHGSCAKTGVDWWIKVGLCSINSPIQASNKGFVICKVNARVYAFVPCRGSSDCRLGCKWFVHSPSACLKLQDGTFKEIGKAFQVKGELANVMTLTWLCPSCWLVMLHVL